MTYDLPSDAGILPPSPPSDPGLPHAWHCSGEWTSSSRTSLRVEILCRGCGVSYSKTLDPRNHKDLFGWCREVVRSPVPASCEDSLAWRILTE